MYFWCNRISYCVSFRITHIVIFSRYRLYFKYQIANRNIGLSTFVLEAQDLPFFTCWSLFVVYLSSGLHWLAGLMVSIIITTSKKHPSETATGGVLQMKVFLTGHQACNCIEKRLQHRCFPVKFAKFLRPPILPYICERLFWFFWALSEIGGPQVLSCVTNFIFAPKICHLLTI